ncbi:hypothetical protein HDE_04600 [Halotydeus destructor]|nr:hypothetical protein HDE_04600 [Halotydeus destructor]
MMTKQVPAQSETKPKVESSTEAVEPLVLTTTQRSPNTVTEGQGAAIYICYGKLSVSIEASWAREMSGRFFREFRETGSNASIELTPTVWYPGALEDLDVIFNHGVAKLTIRDDEHAAQLRKLAKFFLLPILLISLEYEKDDDLERAA